MATRQEARNKRHDAKNIHAPKGKHWCFAHNDGEGAYLPVKNFYKNRTKYRGLDSKCSECAIAYRKKYEEQYGKRSDKTRTFRVSPNTHQMAKFVAHRRGVSIYEFVTASIKFYIKYGCTKPNCLSPRGRLGLCREHHEQALKEAS
jgi:hypothetical protein